MTNPSESTEERAQKQAALNAMEETFDLVSLVRFEMAARFEAKPLTPQEMAAAIIVAGQVYRDHLNGKRPVR